jgi:hypothetical protein
VSKTIRDLRDHLFDVIEALKRDENPLEIQRARAISEVAANIIDSARVENDYMKYTKQRGSDFLELRAPLEGESDAAADPSQKKITSK